MFDPLYHWFGIPPDEQPPNYYRLLGIAKFESNADVIDAAFDRQMTYLHNCANGEHAELAESLMNELSRARLCLLRPEKKSAYDRGLQSESPPPPPAASSTNDSNVAASQPIPPPSPESSERGSKKLDTAVTNSNPFDSIARNAPTPHVTVHAPSRHKHRNLINAIFAIVVSVLILGLIYLVLEIQHARNVPFVDEALDANTTASNVADESGTSGNETTASPFSDHDPDSANPDREQEGISAGIAPSPNSTTPQPGLDSEAVSEPGMDAASTTTSSDVETPQLTPEPEPIASDPPSATIETVPDNRLPIPSPTEIAASQALILELYKDQNAAAESPMEKVALAKQMYQVGADTTDDPVGRFVLWEKFALPIMRQNGNDYGAMIVLTRLGQRYKYPAVEAKSKMLLSAAHSELQQSASLRSHFPKVVEQAIAEDELKIAAQLLAYWSGFAPSKHREALRKAESHVAVLQEKNEDYRAAIQRLPTMPLDAATNMIIGEYRCFLKGQWKEGLPHLAACGNSAIAEAAALEIKYNEAFSKSMEIEIALGDKWHRVASEFSDGPIRETIGQHAAHWYRIAVPQIPEGVTRLKAEKRIAEFSMADARPLAQLASDQTLLRQERFTSNESKSATARFKRNELSVSMGRAPDGLGEAMVGMELLGVENVKVSLSLPRPIDFVTKETKFGYVIDFGSSEGYQYRVFMGVGLFKKQQYNSKPPWGTNRPPDAKVTLRAAREHELNLVGYAPDDWDGRCWITLYMQNAGNGCNARAIVEY